MTFAVVSTVQNSTRSIFMESWNKTL